LSDLATAWLRRQDAPRISPIVCGSPKPSIKKVAEDRRERPLQVLATMGSGVLRQADKH